MAIACEQIRSEFSALLDEELNSEDRELVEEHLSECADCLRELHGYQQVSDAYRYHHPVKAPDDFEERLRLALAPPEDNVRAFPLLWRYAAAAVVVFAVAFTGWRLAGSGDDAIRLTKNEASEMDAATEMMGGADLPALEESIATEDSIAMDGVEEGVEHEVSGSGGGGRFGGGGFGGNGARTDSAAESPQMFRQQAAEASPEPVDGLQKSTVTDDSSDAVTAPVEAEMESSVAASAPAEEFAPPAAPPVAMEDKDMALSTSDEPPATTAPARRAKMATENTEGRRELGAVPPHAGAESPPMATKADESVVASDMQLRVWRKKSFRLHEGILQQEDYDTQDLVVIPIPSAAWTALLDTAPDLTELMEGTHVVIAELKGIWYRFEPSSSE